MPSTTTLAGLHDRRLELLFAAQAFDQDGGALVDEALGQPLMERVGETVLDPPCPFLPVQRLVEPVAAVGHIGPGADIRDPAGQCADIAGRPVDPRDLPFDPGRRNPPLAPGQVHENAADQAVVRLAQNLAEIGNLAAFPQQGDGRRVVEAGAQAGLARQRSQGAEVFRFARRHEIGRRRRQRQALDQRIDRVERQLRIAPEDEGQGIEAVGFDRFDQVGVELAGVGGRAEGAVLHVPAGAPGDLPDLRRAQAPAHAPVELDQIGKGDVAHIHVEAHADGVGGDQIVDLAGLEHFDLGVAGARAERAEHHGRAAAPPPDRLGQRVDVLGRERDRGGARRQAGDFLRAGIGEAREARAGDDPGFGHQPVQDRPDGIGPDQHGLRRPARLEHAVGKDVAAFRIGGELDFVDREEFDVPGPPAWPPRCTGNSAPWAARSFLRPSPAPPHGRRQRARRDRNSRGRAGAAESRSCRSRAPACAPSRNASCRCWSARGRR